MKLQACKILIAAMISLGAGGCAAPEKKPLDIRGMSKDEVKVEVARIALEENKVAARREENKAWWTGVAKTAGTAIVKVSASALMKWLGGNSDGFSKDR